MGVQVGDNKPMAMSFYPKEGNPLWEKESTYAVRNTLITYSRMTIDYPYPVAISVHAASIGMEYPMICFNFGRPNPDGTYSDRTRQRMLMVVVHEVGHNFFPMIINSDERQWKWMDEGINSFVEHMTCVEWYPEINWTSNTPKSITGYMKGDYQRPLMTSSDNILQPGPNGYTKPAAALLHLREVVMGPELFDYAFKEYARRWAFKHPKPADFFRTMEDASAVDLDWFWRGWFYSTDHVDVSIDNVRWFQMASEEPGFENRVKAGQIKIASSGGEGDEAQANKDFSEGPSYFVVKDATGRGEFRSKINNKKIKEIHTGKHFYEITFTNKGGLVTPLLIEWTYADGTKELEKIPAEIWRKNEQQVIKVFVKDKEVVNINLDPQELTADVDVSDNAFPRTDVESRFDRFKEGE